MSGSGQKGYGHTREGPEQHHMLRPLTSVQHLRNPAIPQLTTPRARQHLVTQVSCPCLHYNQLRNNRAIASAPMEDIVDEAEPKIIHIHRKGRSCPPRCNFTLCVTVQCTQTSVPQQSSEQAKRLATGILGNLDTEYGRDWGVAVCSSCTVFGRRWWAGV